MKLALLCGCYNMANLSDMRSATLQDETRPGADRTTTNLAQLGPNFRQVMYM